MRFLLLALRVWSQALTFLRKGVDSVTKQKPIFAALRRRWPSCPGSRRHVPQTPISPRTPGCRGVTRTAGVGAGATPANRTEKPVAVTISKETTYLVSPLRDDGYVDYIASLNQQTAAGVTPQNNALVPLMQVLGPRNVSKEIRAAYFERLESTSARGRRVPGSFRDFVAGLGLDEQQRARVEEEEYKQATEGPWSEPECPHIAQWIARNDPSLTGPWQPRVAHGSIRRWWSVTYQACWWRSCCRQLTACGRLPGVLKCGRCCGLGRGTRRRPGRTCWPVTGWLGWWRRDRR